MTFESSHDSDLPVGGGVSRSGLWLFAPVAMVLFLALRERILPAGDAGSRSAPATPESLGELLPTTSFVGWIPRASDGARVLVRLEPLHPDPTRQAFDAEVLSERFGLPQGEVAPADGGPQPWRLTLIAEAGSDSAPGHPVAANEVAPLVGSLSGVTVSGLSPLVQGGTAGPPDVDVLSAMLGVTSEPLRVGDRADLIFWGPLPQGPVITVGTLGSVTCLPEVREVRRRSEAVAWEDGRADESQEAIK